LVADTSYQPFGWVLSYIFLLSIIAIELELDCMGYGLIEADGCFGLGRKTGNSNGKDKSNAAPSTAPFAGCRTASLRMTIFSDAGGGFEKFCGVSVRACG
jgi:hypothetical protein